MSAEKEEMQPLSHLIQMVSITTWEPSCRRISGSHFQ